MNYIILYWFKYASNLLHVYVNYYRLELIIIKLDTASERVSRGIDARQKQNHLGLCL